MELIVTVDNGISALDEAVYATELGIDLIITDHHQPRPQPVSYTHLDVYKRQDHVSQQPIEKWLMYDKENVKRRESIR